MPTPLRHAALSTATTCGTRAPRDGGGGRGPPAEERCHREVGRRASSRAWVRLVGGLVRLAGRGIPIASVPRAPASARRLPLFATFPRRAGRRADSRSSLPCYRQALVTLLSTPRFLLALQTGAGDHAPGGSAAPGALHAIGPRWRCRSARRQQMVAWPPLRAAPTSAMSSHQLARCSSTTSRHLRGYDHAPRHTECPPPGAAHPVTRDSPAHAYHVPGASVSARPRHIDKGLIVPARYSLEGCLFDPPAPVGFRRPRSWPRARR